MEAKQRLTNPILKIGEQISVGLPGGGHRKRGEFVTKRIDYNGQHIYKLTGGRFYTNIAGKPIFTLSESRAKARVDSYKTTGKIIRAGFIKGGKGWSGMVFIDLKGKSGDSHGRLNLQQLTESQIRMNVPSQYVDEVIRQKRAGMKNVVLINSKKAFVPPKWYVPPKAVSQSSKRKPMHMQKFQVRTQKQQLVRRIPDRHKLRTVPTTRQTTTRRQTSTKRPIPQYVQYYNRKTRQWQKLSVATRTVVGRQRKQYKNIPVFRRK